MKLLSVLALFLLAAAAAGYLSALLGDLFNRKPRKK